MCKILFVCHGNICRSPIAEFIMKQLAAEQGVAERFYIESAATSREELGNPVYPPAKKVLNNRGIDCSKKRARQVTLADGEKFDYLICMDDYNVQNIKRLIKPEHFCKVYKLLDFTDNSGDVADPWYTGDFSATERDVENGCNGLLKFLLNK